MANCLPQLPKWISEPSWTTLSDRPFRACLRTIVIHPRDLCSDFQTLRPDDHNLHLKPRARWLLYCPPFIFLMRRAICSWSIPSISVDVTNLPFGPSPNSSKIIPLCRYHPSFNFHLRSYSASPSMPRCSQNEPSQAGIGIFDREIRVASRQIVGLSLTKQDQPRLLARKGSVQ